MPETVIANSIAKTTMPLFHIFGAWAVSLIILIVVAAVLVIILGKTRKEHRQDRNDWIQTIRDDRNEYSKVLDKKDERQVQLIENNTEAFTKQAEKLETFTEVVMKRCS